MLKKLLIAILIIATTICAEQATFDFTTQTGTGTGWTWHGGLGVLNILDGADVRITGTSANGRILLGNNVKAKITLDGVNITTTANQSSLMIFTELTLTLIGENTIVNAGGGGFGEGIFLQNSSLIAIEGSGSLNVRSNSEAGISLQRSATLNINSGTIIANGSNNGSLDGGILFNSGSTLNVAGGILLANSFSFTFANTGTRNYTGGVVIVGGDVVYSKEIKGLTDNLATANQTIGEREQTITALGEVIDGLEDDIEDLNFAYNRDTLALQADTLRLFQESAQKTITIGQRNDKIVELRDSISDLEDEIEELLKKLKSCEDGKVSNSSIIRSDNNHGIRFAENIVSERAEMSVILPNNDASAGSATIKIYDMTGNVVFVGATALGRPLSWDLRNNAGRFVANGTYLVIAEAKDRNGRVYTYSARLGVKR